MNGRRKRVGFVRVIVRKIAFAAADRRTVAGDVQIIDVFDQICDEKERVDLVLVLGRFGELVGFVGARFKSGLF